MQAPSRRHSFMLAAGLLASPAFVGGCSSKSSATPSDSGAETSATACPATDDVISDFTTDNGVHPVDGRQGGWYTYAAHTGFGTLKPAEGAGVVPDLTEGNPDCSGLGSLHVTAMGIGGWGAATGVDLKPIVSLDGGGQAKGTYDASKYRGIVFWAKAAAPVKFVQVKFLDPYTENPSVVPPADVCVYDATKPNNCSPYLVKFGYGRTGDDLTAAMADFPKYINVEIDTKWKRFEVLFSDTKQDRYNPGTKSPGDKLSVAQLEGLAIQVNSDNSTMPPTANDFDLWIDDVAFLK